MSESKAYRRVIRRESHSPRSAAMAVAALLTIVTLAYCGTEIVLALGSWAPLLISPAAAAEWLAALPEAQPAWAIITAAALFTIVGLVAIVLGVAPGRLPKQEMRADGRVVLADNGVVAAALAQGLSARTGIPRDHIGVGVSHRSVDVVVRSDAGADESRVREVVAEELDQLELSRPLKIRVRKSRPVEGARS